jgi:HAD superfamily hydrolase (TIGR01549 family)
MAEAIDAVLFDFDNTLVDFMDMKTKSMDAGIDALLAHGLPGPKCVLWRMANEAFRSNTMEDPHIFENIITYRGIRDPVRVAMLTEAAVRAYRVRQREVMKPYDGVPETLEELSRREIRMGILSDAPVKKVYNRLFENGIAKYFAKMVVGYDVRTGYKPSPAAFKKGMKLLGRTYRPERVLMVGDNIVRDCKGAKTMGMQSAWAKYGVHKITEDDEILSKEVDYVLDRFSDLLGIVKK